MSNTQLLTEPLVGSIISLQALENEKFVIGKILKGGMGTVYQLIPVHPVWFPPLALKTYQELAERSQFMKEVELWISLGTHPYISHARAYTEWGPKPAIIADWYDKSLAETKIMEWPSPNIIKFSLQLVEGLCYALDSTKIIHQDIKPSNVLLDTSNAPRLSDFGMASFAIERLGDLRSIDDLQKDMNHSILLGGIGGTPLYMAPELFFGGSPSVRTDIYSLGVTFYEALTGQHPFLGAETGYRFRPILRNAPLRLVFNERGQEIQPLISLIIAALRLSPESRPNSYTALISEAGLHNLTAHQQRRSDQVSDIIVQAAFLRSQGRHGEAETLLRNSLQKSPTNLFLLNSYAILLLTEGRKLEAHEMFKMALESLSLTSGKHEGKLYIDPAVNLAGQMIAANEFSQADQTLSVVFKWCVEYSPVLLFNYPEFGWWYLYNGKTSGACDHILKVYRSKSPDEAAIAPLMWLTLAAWLSEKFSEYADQIAELYLTLENLTVVSALNACVLANYSMPTLAKRLVDHAYGTHEEELIKIANELGVKPPTFKPPLDLHVCKTVIRSLDMAVTGGKYYGTIG